MDRCRVHTPRSSGGVGCVGTLCSNRRCAGGRDCKLPAASIIAFFMHGMLWGFAALLAYSAGAPFAVVFGFKLWTRTPIARRMVLGNTDADSEGVQPIKVAAGQVAVGTEGVALTPLRPIGFVRFGDLRMEAAAEMGMIDVGAVVTVVESTGDRVVVRARG